MSRLLAASARSTLVAAAARHRPVPGSPGDVCEASSAAGRRRVRYALAAGCRYQLVLRPRAALPTQHALHPYGHLLHACGRVGQCRPQRDVARYCRNLPAPVQVARLLQVDLDGARQDPAVAGGAALREVSLRTLVRSPVARRSRTGEQKIRLNRPVHPPTGEIGYTHQPETSGEQERGDIAGQRLTHIELHERYLDVDEFESVQ